MEIGATRIAAKKPVFGQGSSEPERATGWHFASDEVDRYTQAAQIVCRELGLGARRERAGAASFAGARRPRA